MRSSVGTRSRGRLRVLVVDDDPLVRRLLHAVIQDGKYDLLEASDGIEALQLAGKDPPDAVILDVMMPGVNGYEVCRALRADPRARDARIVILTARDTDQDRAQAEAAGADAFFTKPFSPLELLEAIAPAAHGKRTLAR
ncbi:MAG TPA: response regulator [Actinomycetota bacterium]